jgi:hypothetical protein
MLAPKRRGSAMLLDELRARKAAIAAVGSRFGARAMLAATAETDSDS